MTLSNAKPIVGLSVVVDESWHEIPLGAGAGDAWAADLVTAEGVQGPAETTLQNRLATLQRNLAASVGDRCSALVWVPAAVSGYWSGTLVAVNWPVSSSGISDPESFLREFGDGAFIDDGDTVLEQRLWSGEFTAGPFAAAHRVTSSTSGAEDLVLESVDFVVFPPGSSEFAHLTFAAESITAFDDMPAQTSAIAETLEVGIGDAS